MKRFRDYISLPERTFRAYWVEQGIPCSAEFTSEDDLGDDPCEWEISIMEIMDKVWALGVNASMHFMAIRDDRNSHGFIVRVK